MKIMKLKDLDNYGHDVYEFCYGKVFPENYWNNDSFYLTMEDFSLLEPFLDKVFPNYHYYGNQKVSIEEWNMVKELYLSSKEKDKRLLDFFILTENWLGKGNDSLNYFWILGV